MLSHHHGRKHPRQGAPSQARRPRPRDGEQPRRGQQGWEQTGVCLLSPPLAKLTTAGLTFRISGEGGGGCPTAGRRFLREERRKAALLSPGHGDTGTWRHRNTGTWGWASRGQVLSRAARAQPPWTRHHRPTRPPAQAQPSTHPRRRSPHHSAHLGILRLHLHRSCRDTGGWLRHGRSGPRSLPDRRTAL